MHLVIGGRSQGKLNYAKTEAGGDVPAVDFISADFDKIGDAVIVYNLHLGVKKMLEEGLDPVESFIKALPSLKGKILIGDEIGSGIVPADPFERSWRDETGRVYVVLSENASRVDRVWAGCIQNLKGKDE